MSDERIQIEIEDKIAPTLEDKLIGIANAARVGYDHIERLKAAMKSIDGSALNRLATGFSRAQKAINDAAISSSRLTLEQHKVSAAAIAASTAQQKLQTAATQTAVAQQQLTAAIQRANAAQAQTATATSNAAAAQSRAAQAALRLEQAQTRAAASGTQMERQAEALKRQLFPLYDAQQRYNSVVTQANALHQAGAIDASVYAAALDRAKFQLDATTIATNRFNTAQNRMGKTAQLNRAHLTNLGFQLNDIGISLAGGQNPLLVLIQQGSQIAGIASQAGVGISRLAKEAAIMVSRFIPVVAIFGTIIAAIKLLNSEASEGAGLKKYAESLGATQKQIKALNLDTVSFGDSMRGLWKTINDATGIGDALSKVWGWIKDFFTAVLKIAGVALTSFVALFQAAFDTIVNLWQTFPKRFLLFFADVGNAAIELFENIANSGINAANKVIEAFNAVSAIEIKPFENLKLDRIDTSQFADASKSLVSVFVDSYVDNLAKNQGKVSKFLADWQKNSVNAAKDRIKNALTDEKTTENRAAALAKVNAQLDNELDRMMALKPIREDQQKFDRIEEQLLGKKIKLTAEEAASIRDKIKAIGIALPIQAEMDRIYEESTGALRNLNNVQAANTILLAKGAITLDDAARSQTIATEAYLNSISPLREYNKEINQQMELLSMLPREREVAQQLQQIENQLLGKGIQLTIEQTAALKERLKAQQQMNIASQAEAAIWENSVGARQQMLADIKAIAALKRSGAITSGDATNAVSNLLPEDLLKGTQQQIDAEMELLKSRNEQLEAMRANDLLSEQAYSAAKLKIAADTFSLQTQNTKAFFGGLAGLMSSGNTKLFKIGQKAAIANAVISGTEAVLNAMAVKPWYVGAALAVAQAVTSANQIAQIRNAKAPTGFARGGYTGNGPANQMAGVVHGKEFVMNAGATSRIGVENLQALQRGAASVQTTNNVSGGGVSVTIQNYGTSKTYEKQQLSANEIRIIARDEVAKGAPDVISAEIGNPNSKVSKSLGKNTLASRRR